MLRVDRQPGVAAVLLVLCQSIAGQAAEQKVAAPAVVTECDRQAAEGPDPDRVAPGRARAEINFEVAIPACLAALEADPDNGRLNFQMGRLYGYSGQWKKAMPYRMKAVAARYPHALFIVGYLYLTGETIDRKDPCTTLEMWRDAARRNHLPAQVSLPHYAKSDAFAGCGSIATDELKGYLALAEKNPALDYYASLLVAELKRSVGQ